MRSKNFILLYSIGIIKNTNFSNISPLSQLSASGESSSKNKLMHLFCKKKGLKYQNIMKQFKKFR